LNLFNPFSAGGPLFDCHTAALVGRDGSIDWLCWPRFDSAACFAALLGTSDNRRWLIAPAAPSPRKSRHYRDGALVLETDFETVDGQATLTDFSTRLFGCSAFVTSSISFRQNTMSAFGAWNFSLCTFSYCARQNRP
jgi:GH15 family glucan-1,4-alpha-glucosidase